jgi:hypothetical protein
MENITKEQFLKFEKLKSSGVINMTDIVGGAKLLKVSEEDYETIIFNYKELKEKFSISTTIGVYPNGDMKLNGVIASNLAKHIAYNKETRPGRALFVDGKCRLSGNLTRQQIVEYEKLFQSDAKYTLHKDTQPYQ